MVRPRALAVFRLMVGWNLVSCSPCHLLRMDSMGGEGVKSPLASVRRRRKWVRIANPSLSLCVTISSNRRLIARG